MFVKQIFLFILIFNIYIFLIKYFIYIILKINISNEQLKISVQLLSWENLLADAFKAIKPSQVDRQQPQGASKGGVPHTRL